MNTAAEERESLRYSVTNKGKRCHGDVQSEGTSCLQMCQREQRMREENQCYSKLRVTMEGTVIVIIIIVIIIIVTTTRFCCFHSFSAFQPVAPQKWTIG